HRLTGFLAQYWGGPTTYSDERGHPRLRMRHLPFHIGPAERDHWLTHMSAAVVETCAELSPELVDPRAADDVRDRLLAYFVATAEHMRNDTGLPISTRRA
ncbi:MAG: globin, partial [Ilumatobacteraceae bacterium]